MAITLLAAGLSFLIPPGTGRIASVLLFICEHGFRSTQPTLEPHHPNLFSVDLYTLAYAFGEGRKYTLNPILRSLQY